MKTNHYKTTNLFSLISKRFILVLALALAGMAAKAQTANYAYIFYNATYGYLVNNGGNPGVSTTFNKNAIWVANNTMGTTSRNVHSYTDDSKYFTGSNGTTTNNGTFSLGTSNNQWRINNNYLNRAGNTRGYVRYNGTGFIVNSSNADQNFTGLAITINQSTPVNPTISITSAAGLSNGGIQLTGNVTGSYIPTYYYASIRNYNNNNNQTYYWTTTTDATTTQPTGITDWSDATKTWAVTTGGTYASVSSDGLLTITGNPTGNVVVTLTVTKDGYTGTQTFTLTRAAVAQSTNTETTINSFSLSPNSAALYVGESQAFTASAIVDITTYNTPAHTSLTGGDNTYLYYNGTLYTNTVDFSTTSTTTATPNYAWSMTGAGSSNATLSATSGASTTLTHTPGVSSDTTLTLTVGASYTGATSQTKTAQVSLYAPFVAPTITRSGNNVILSTSSLGATIYYTIDGSTPSASNGIVYTAPINLESLTLPVTIKVMAVRGGESTAIAEETFSTLSLEAPVISISSTGVVTITSSTEGASIRYTTDGTNPTSSTGTVYNGTFTVNNLTTVKAIAYKAGYADSEIATEQYITSGISGGKVILNDLEDHSWSYYSDGNQPVRSLNPADVKVTYLGNGNNVSTSNDANPALNTFTAASTTVKVGIDADADTFVYYKTLERVDGSTSDNPTGRCAYTTIPNPFSVRPTYGDGDTRWRGFYAWRVKSVSGGTIYNAATGNTTIGEGGTINAETEVYFAPTSEYGMEVQLEALWARAYVTNGTGNLGTTTNSYERNFHIVTQSTAASNYQKTYPLTVSAYYPDGTAANGSLTGGFTGASNSKFENISLTNSGDWTANNHDLIFGRGVTGTVNNMQGTTNGNITSLNYMLRLESGTISHLTFVRDGAENVSGRATIRSICGSDYDRAIGDNTKLTVSRGNSLFFSLNGTFGSQNKDVEVFNLVVKSGKYQENYWVDGDDASYTHTFYCGHNSAGSGNYPGVRYVTVEGGEMGSMNGGRGVGAEDVTYATPGVITFDLRVKGGLFHGSVFGSAADNPSIGSRKIVITGGEIQGWVAAGANGIGNENRTSTVNGDSYVYVGGNAIVGGPRARTVNYTRGGNVFGASRGKDQEAAINTSRVVIADNAEVSNSSYPVDGGNVYGGGFSGFAKVQSNVYILGGTISNSVYGGGYGCRNANETPEANIWMKGGTVLGGVFGGNNTVGKTKNVNMYINGGTVGSSSSAANVHGGGYGQATAITGNINLTVGTEGATSGVTIYGDVYGGSALGQVNATATVTPTYNTQGYVTSATITNVLYASNTSTNVTLNKGTINGSLYGGGLGDGSTAANVYGPVAVKVYGGSVNTTSASGSGAVYGCNNINGAPQRAVTVDIYGTDPAPSADAYALDAVYGGGNKANYGYGTPVVTVHNCDNSIGYVYGGGNAAHITNGNTDVTIYGGNKIGNVFGGGNGTVTAANVSGNTNVKIYGGTILKVFGGSNSQGAIDGTINVTARKNSTCKIDVDELYGGGNLAASNAGNITIGCMDEEDMINYVYGGANQADISGNIALNMYGGRVGNLFGGNNHSGAINGDITINVDWNDNCSNNYLGNVFGGGNFANYNRTPKVNIKKGTVSGNVYGGGNEAGVAGGDVVMTGGTVLGGLYGGCNTSGVVSGNIVVSIEGGTVGAADSLNAYVTANVFGGGYGSATSTTGNVLVEVKQGNGVDTPPSIYGDVYGGSALGDVNTNGTNTTTVNIFNGTLHSVTDNSTGFPVYIGGNVYGGGLGRKADSEHSAVEAKVFGAVTVNIGSGVPSSTETGEHFTGNATIGGNVYGGNNAAGSPMDNVTVNVYRTAHIEGVNTVDDEGFAIANVFGGGNEADYVPAEGKRSIVNVFGCFNTIGRTFGGGNAAETPRVETNIQGGHFSQVFGGGNGERGENYGADVHGNVDLTILGGTVGEFYGGSNRNGTISGTINVLAGGNGPCGDLTVTDFFCGGNFVDITNDLTTTINCSTSDITIANLYGGCNQANITGNVVLNVYGGIYTNVFGGSKGRLRETNGPEDPGKSANISGNVTLNLYGGAIENAFGGSNVRGNITGTITVNVLDIEEVCPLYITNIYGGSNLASYEPTNPNAISPVVNVAHAKNGIGGNVYGGGKGLPGTDADVKSNPRVNIGYNSDMDGNIPASYLSEYASLLTSPRAIVAGSVFGGGDAAKVIGNTAIFLRNKAKVFGNVYGGGNMGEVTGDTKVIVNGENQ